MSNLKKLLKKGNIIVTRNTCIFKGQDINPLSVDDDLKCIITNRGNSAQWDIMTIKTKLGKILYRREYEDCEGLVYDR